MALLTDAQMRDLRAEIGSTPDDDALQDLWDAIGPSVPAVALAVLRPRLADAVTAAAEGGITITGVLGVTPPSQPTLLAQQISRLEAALADETGEMTPLGATSVLAGRYDRPR